MTEEIAVGSAEEDEQRLRSGLVSLVLALVEIVDDALEREAVRRMESGQLSDEEIERLGTQLRDLNEEIAALEEREGVTEEVEQLRGQLSEAVSDALSDLDADEFGGDRP